jgi:hypothetical protein
MTFQIYHARNKWHWILLIEGTKLTNGGRVIARSEAQGCHSALHAKADIEKIRVGAPGATIVIEKEAS